jgi:hypothetical protein
MLQNIGQQLPAFALGVFSTVVVTVAVIVACDLAERWARRKGRQAMDAWAKRGEAS